MIWRTEWHPPIPLKLDHHEGFHNPPLTYDAQITVCLVGFLAHAKIPSVSILTDLTRLVLYPY
jgi:hypothetical protein